MLFYSIESILTQSGTGMSARLEEQLKRINAKPTWRQTGM